MRLTKFIVALVLALVISTPALGCDRAASQKVQRLMHEMATWYDKDGVTTFKWGADWDDYAPHERLDMVTVFADADACLTGRAREINFYRHGKLVAKASPSSGIRLIK